MHSGSAFPSLWGKYVILLIFHLGPKVWTLFISFCLWIVISLEVWVLVLRLREGFIHQCHVSMHLFFFGTGRSLSIWFSLFFWMGGKIGQWCMSICDMCHFSMVAFSCWHSLFSLPFCDKIVKAGVHMEV